MGCSGWFNGCANLNDLQGYDIVVPLALDGLDTQATRDDSVFVYAGQNGENGPEGEILEVDLNDLNRDAISPEIFQSIAFIGNITPDQIQAGQEIAYNHMIDLYLLVKEPNLIDIQPRNPDDIAHYFQDNPSYLADRVKESLNSTPVQESYHRLTEFAADNPEFSQWLQDRKGIDIDTLSLDDWGELRASSLELDNGILDSIEHLSTVDAHRANMVEMIAEHEELDYDTQVELQSVLNGEISAYDTSAPVRDANSEISLPR